jgi:hypothetical protein
MPVLPVDLLAPPVVMDAPAVLDLGDGNKPRQRGDGRGTPPASARTRTGLGWFKAGSLYAGFFGSISSA